MTTKEIKTLAFCLDGLRYSFAMAELCIQRINETLASIARKKQTGEKYEVEAASALLDAWSIVDMCHRVRQLVQQTPGLSAKTPQIQVFLRATEQVEELRHYVQHFRNEIPNIPEQSTPLWGAIGWVADNDPLSCYMMISGNIVPGVTTSSIPFDTHEHHFMSRLSLQAGNFTVDLDSTATKLKETRACIHEWIDQKTNIKRVEGKTLVTATRYNMVKRQATITT